MIKNFIKSVVTYKNIEFILLIIMLLFSYCVPVYFTNFSNRKLWTLLSLLLLLVPSIIIGLNIYFNSNSAPSKKTNNLLYKYVVLTIFSVMALVIFGASYGPSSEIGVGKIQLFAKIISSPEILTGIGVAIPTIYIWIREEEEKAKEKLLFNYQSWLKDFSLIKGVPNFTDRLAIELLLKQDVFNLIEHVEILSIFQRKFNDSRLKTELTLNEALKWQEFFSTIIVKIEKSSLWDIINSSDFTNIYFIDFSKFINSSADMEFAPLPIGVKRTKYFSYSKFPDAEFETDFDLYFSYCLFDKIIEKDINNIHLQPNLYYLKSGFAYDRVDVRSNQLESKVKYHF